MPIASAVAGIGGNLISGFLGSNAAQQAAQAQVQSQNKAMNGINTGLQNGTQAQNNVWQGDQSNLAPYQGAGTAALSQLGGSVLSGTPSASAVLAQDPGYQFRLDQGQVALDRANAAAGGTMSGGALKAAQQYGQEYASGEYQNAFNRYLQGNQQRYSQLMGIADLGQNANQMYGTQGANFANQTGQLQMNAAEQNANALTNIGNAQASGYVGQANAWSNAIGGIQQSLPGLSGLFSKKTSVVPNTQNTIQYDPNGNVIGG